MAIRLLIADDHAVFRSGLKALLEREVDLDVVGEAADGGETLAAVRRLELDVVVLDVSMPGLAGPQVAEQVLESKPDLRIVVLTMHQDEYYLQAMLKAGAQAFVLKKSTGTDLIQAIRAVHRGEQYIDPALISYVLSPYTGRAPEPRAASKSDELTPREREVCRELALGHTNPEVADRLHISVRTVETHRNHLMSKLGLKTRAQLVRFAIDNGLLRLE